MAWKQTQSDPKYKTREHRRERQRWVVLMDRQGWLSCCQPACLMPTRLIRRGEPWHLGHTDDGVAYVGPTHATCNVKDGARRGRARVGMPRGWSL